MKKSNLGSNEPLNEQDLNEGFSGKNVVETNTLSSPELKTEFETDAQGITSEVERARYSNTEMNVPKSVPLVDYPTESIHQTPEKAEHKDLNSNPNPKQFPDETKQNQQNRGNLDE